MSEDQIMILGLVGYCLFAYLIGSLPTGFLVVRALKGVDIRDFGSGNTGATNVKRVAGGKAALFVLLIDFLKGFIPVFIFPWIFPPTYEWIRVLVALLTMVGHSRSIFLKFSGGKAAITGLACILALEPLMGLCSAVIALSVFFFTRIVSAASLTAALLTPLLMWFMKVHESHFIFALIGGVVVFYLHRTNIQRLIQGKENRI